MNTTNPTTNPTTMNTTNPTTNPTTMNTTNPTTNPTTMNTEQQPEPLAAILREMRGNEFDDPHLDADGIIGARRLARDWADRIEAAVKREQQDAMKTAFLTKCKVCEKVGPAAAPGNAAARNCDRFKTADEAVAAFADHLRAWENAHGICSEYPDHAVQVPAGAFAWLFDKAKEGGDHA